LRGRQLSDSDLQKICDKLPNHVTDIDLSSNSIGDAGVEQLVNALKERKGLKINLSDNNVGDEGLRQLSLLLSLDNIKELDLSMNEITAAGAAHLDLSRAAVAVLNLQGNELGDEGALKIALEITGGHTKLLELDVSNNGIQTTGAAALLTAAANCSLQTLRMDDTEPPLLALGDHIVALSKSGLRSLSLRCIGLTDRHAATLAATLALNPPASSMVLDLRNNGTLGATGRTALQGLSRLKSTIELLL